MELRDRIIQSALEIFGEVGYEKATIAQIVKRADSSKGGFYHHFESKKEVLDEITTMFLNEIVEGCNVLLNDPDRGTIDLLNNIFISINDIKKEKLNDLKELTNLYAHKDSTSIIQSLYFSFLDITTNIYEQLIQRGIDEGLFSVSSPKALASLWCNEITKLYGQVSVILVNINDQKLYDDFMIQAQFVEDTINHALGSNTKLISVAESLSEYLDMAIEMTKKMNDN